MSATETGTLMDRLKAFVGKRAGPRQTAPDPVNEPMIRHWVEALGDTNPVYVDEHQAKWSVHGGIVAPPTMLQVWGMRGLRPPAPPGENAQSALMAILDEAGFTSIVATNCEQTYNRYLRPGDVLTASSVIDSVSEEKRTGLGAGHFFTTVTTYCDQDGEVVGTMMQRYLKFRPPDAQPGGSAPPGAKPAEDEKPASRPRPAISKDTEFFWDGARNGELLIQRCASCKTLRHPARPMCGKCGSLDWDTVRSGGRGEVYSFVVHHYPPVPGFEVPFVVALIELEEGTRVVSNIPGVPPEDVEIGMPVEVYFEAFGDDLTLPQFRPRKD
jgi:3-oxo-4,17-pregnadiene-20-carboxyl-CoA hydratase alpha subunit